MEDRGTLPTIGRPEWTRRPRVGLKGELLLALLPTLAVLGVLALVDALTRQRLLFASLASSAFLIYLDPTHATNSVRTLMLAQLGAASIGWGSFALLGPGLLSGGTAMVVTITLMVVLDLVHPPAVATAMSFALRAGTSSNVVLFALSVLITCVLVVLERSALWLLARHGSAQEQREQRE